MGDQGGVRRPGPGGADDPDRSAGPPPASERGLDLILDEVDTVVDPIGEAMTFGPAKPIRARGSARIKSPSDAKLAATPPIVGWVSTLI